MKSKSQSGHSIIVAIVLLLVIAVVGGATYVTINKTKKDNDDLDAGKKTQAVVQAPKADTSTTDTTTVPTPKSNAAPAAGTNNEQLSDDRASVEINAVYMNLETYYNEYGYYPSKLDLTKLTKLKQVDLTDESGAMYDYLSSGCDADDCTSYTLKYKFKLANPKVDTDGDGYIIKKSLN